MTASARKPRRARTGSAPRRTRAVRPSGHDRSPVYEPIAEPMAGTLRRAVEEAARLLPADGSLAYILDEERGTLRIAHDAGLSETDRELWMRRLELPLGVGMFGKAVGERRVIVTGDYFADTAFVHYERADRFAKAAGMRSMVVAPMIAGDRTFGALGTYSHEADAFGEAEVGLVRALADHAAAGMANALLIAELDRSRLELERSADVERALRDIGARISALRDPSDVLQLAVDEAARLLAADGARIDRLDEATGGLYWAYDATTGRRPGLGRIKGKGEAKPGEGISGQAVIEGRAVWTGDYLADERFEHASAPDRHVRRHGIRSAVAAPLLGDRGALGTLTAYSDQVDAYGPPEAQLVEIIAGQAAIAITNARLIEEVAASREAEARRADAERTLREIAARITAIRDPADLLQHVVEEAARLLGAERSRIDLLGTDGRPGSTHLVGSADTPGASAVASGGGPVVGGIAGLAVREGRTVVTDNYLADDRFERDPRADEAARKDGIHSVVAAPLFGEGELLGVLQIGSPRREAFSGEDVAVVEALAHQASVAVQNVRLIEELGRSREEIARRADAERSLRQIAARLTAIRDPADLLQHVVDEAKRLLRADGTILDLYDPATRRLYWAYDSDLRGAFRPDEIDQLWVPLGVGATGVAVAEDRVVVVRDDPISQFPPSPDSDRFFAVTAFRSLVAAPITGDAGPLGAIEVYSRRPSAFDDDDGELIRSLAHQAAIAIQNARLIEELDRSRVETARRAQGEQAVREIAAQISALRDPNAVLQRTVDEARRLLSSEIARIDLLEGDQLRMVFESGDRTIMAERPDPLFGSMPLGTGVAGKAIRDRATVRTGDYLADRLFVHHPDGDVFAERTGIRSALAAPLLGETGPLGALTVNSRRPDTYDDEQAALLQALADQAAIAIQNTRLIEELQRSRTDLAARAETERSLREMAGRIAELRDPTDVLEQVVEETRRLLRSDGAHLTRLSDDRTFVVPVIVAGGMDDPTREWLTGQEFPIDGGINGLAAGGGQPVWTEDYLLDPRIPLEPEDLATAERLGLRGMAAVPLRASAGEIIGTLAVSYDHPRTFDNDEIELLQGMADHAAIAITNASLYARLQESEERYRHLVQNSPDLVWAIDGEARLTFVSDTCERLTGWRPEELLGRHFGALVHESSREVAELDWTVGMTEPSQELRGRLNLLHRDGHAIPAEFIALGRLDEDGRFAGANGSVRDMSERDRLERELRDSEERWRYLAKASPDVVWAVDDRGVITFMSDRIEALTGFRPDEVVGQHFEILTDPASMPASIVVWESVQGDPDGVFPLAILMPRRNTEPIPVEIWVTGSVRDGRFSGAHGSIRDMRERETFERDLRRQAAELAASDERAHLARELHDSVTQALFSMTLLTRTIEMLIDRDPGAAREQLSSLRDLQREALAEMRALIFELRPGNLEQDGLIHALRTHAAALQGRVGLPIVVTSEIDERFPIEVEEVLYRIAQEALHNTVKHAAARQVRLDLAPSGSGVRLRIEDDGRGFDPDTVPHGHLGLTGMRARAERIGADLTVRSRPGAGTVVDISVSRQAIAARQPQEPRVAGIGGTT